MFQFIGFSPNSVTLSFNEETAGGTVLATVEKDTDGSKEYISH